MAREPTPEVKAAITKGVIAELLLLGAGGALFYLTGEVYWLVGLTIAGSAIMVFFMAMAGAFDRDERR